MIRRTLTSAAVVAAVALSVFVAGAQSTGDTLTLSVRLDAKPLAGAHIEVVNSTGRPQAESTIPASGLVKLPVRAGTGYTALIGFLLHNKHYTYTLTNLSVYPGAYQIHHLFILSRSLAAPDTNVDAAVTIIPFRLPTMIKIAEGELRQHEQPFGTNAGGHVSVYEHATPDFRTGIFWCAAFVSWAAQRAGIWLGPTGRGHVSIQKIIDNWAVRPDVNLFAPRDSYRPKPGDLVVYFPSPQEGQQGIKYGHIGIVSSVGQNTFNTVEGNTYLNKGAAGAAGQDYWVAERHGLSFHAAKVMGYIQLSQIFSA